MRSLALVAALAAFTFGTHTLAAQSSSSTTSTKPAMRHAAPTTAAQDTTKAKTTAATTGKSTMHHAAWTKDQIKEAQEGLSKAGLYKGKATGTFNADTRKALREYQKENHMPVTGRLSDSVLVKLKSA